ncbi:MAG: hypothetical protein RBU30_05655 [Polyangia bacterium]|nr:hypothetical protein [Polyangia bacterium]
MKKQPSSQGGPAQPAHFSWPDMLVLAGALILVPVSIYERNWFFFFIGLGIAAALGIRILVTRALAGRALAGRALAGRALAGRADTRTEPCPRAETPHAGSSTCGSETAKEEKGSGEPK